MQLAEGHDSVIDMGSELPEIATHIASVCNDCEACVRSCAFLQEYGTPRSIADRLVTKEQEGQGLLCAFECSLCGLCGAICPEKLSPEDMFLAMRRAAQQAGEVDSQKHSVLLRYEKTGNSPLFSWYGLPKQCDTVFFPGCTFAGTRSQTTWELFTYIRQHLPAVGVVLDCCGKPSHDLGRQEQFLQKFEVMNQYLVGKGVHKVLVTCPNCLAVFKQYGRGVEAITVYQFIARHGLPSTAKVMGRCVIHDPCSIRGEEETHAAVRELTGEKGVEFEELNRRMGTTLCCGEGGAVGFVRPEFAEKWTRMRGEQAKGKNILTYCAGCATSLSRHGSVWHILDLIFFPVEVTEGRFRTTRTPFTYLRRLILKMRLRRLPGLEDDRA